MSEQPVQQGTDWRRVPGKAAARWRRRTKPGRVVCACLTSWCCHGTDVFHLGMHRMRKIAA